MNFVSYAQNNEDVLLWRALKHIEKGFYVDVGANDPVVDSVTQAFYERGWHGINIEPVSSYYERLCEMRPKDINIHVAVGNAEKVVDFYEIPDTGLSTINKDVAQSYKEKGIAVNEKHIPTLTLNHILSSYQNQEIHFLKIDVEGAEGVVLEGLDLSVYRPWILVIESIHPSSKIKIEPYWESIILNADYCFAFFDGVNRFYYAKEHAELREALSTPANVLDSFTNYITNDTLEIHRKNAEHQNIYIQEQDKAISSLKNEVAQKQEEILRLQNELSIKQEALHALQNENEKVEKEQQSVQNDLYFLKGKFELLLSEYTELKQNYQAILSETVELKYKYRALENDHLQILNERHALQQQLFYTQTELSKVYQSFSVRITAPLRTVAGMFKGLRGIKDLIKRILRKIVYFLRHTYPFSVILEKIKAANPTLWDKLARKIKEVPPLPQTEVFPGENGVVSEEEKRYVEFFKREMNWLKAKDRI